MQLHPLDDIADCVDCFLLFIGQFNLKLILKSHYEFEAVKTAHAQVVNKMRVGRNILPGIKQQRFSQHSDYTLFNRHRAPRLLKKMGARSAAYRSVAANTNVADSVRFRLLQAGGSSHN